MLWSGNRSLGEGGSLQRGQIRVGRASRNSLRPRSGLLAGLFQPPTTPVAVDSTPEDRESVAAESIHRYVDTDQRLVSTKRSVASVPHIFSHINMVYHVVHLVMTPDGHSDPPQTKSTGVWLDAAGVESANVGTGVKKVWSAVYGSWGSFECGKGAPKSKSGGKKRKSEAPTSEGSITRWLVPKP